jgi:hypothetical protein
VVVGALRIEVETRKVACPTPSPLVGTRRANDGAKGIRSSELDLYLGASLGLWRGARGERTATQSQIGECKDPPKATLIVSVLSTVGTPPLQGRGRRIDPPSTTISCPSLLIAARASPLTFTVKRFFGAPAYEQRVRPSASLEVPRGTPPPP